ncbi:MAG: hypothetical protein N838_25960 [Thiohalocapsa sp. PB-PSB1]|nr:MAG: hypothetical protein N838_25960 [Thiohalocapsa sp. PB-PSB1]
MGRLTECIRRRYGRRKQEIVGGAESLFGRAREPKPAATGASDERLYVEFGRLKVELDWLK